MAKTAEELALEEYFRAGENFQRGGAPEFERGEDFQFEDLGELDRLGPSAYGDIQSDPRFRDNEFEALRQLEEQSRDGFSAQDRADVARIETNANRANRGRQGAIDNEMQARGLGGSGLEFAMRQQAAQDAAEMEALSGLELGAQIQNRKQSAAERLGNLSSTLQQRDFQQNAQKAAAADEIARFNTQNSNARREYNNQGLNSANSQNWQRTNTTKDNNTSAAYDYRRDQLGIEQGNAAKKYDYATELYNRQQAEKAAKARKRSGMGAAIGGAIGTAAGAYFGGPAGAAAGAGVGSSIGGAFAHGGKIEGPEITEGDSHDNDIIPITVSAQEIIIPKTIGKDPIAAAKFVAQQNGEELDPIAMLLEAMQQMRKK